MKKKFIEEEFCYCGKELAPCWIYRKHGVQGDAIVSWIGECDVKIDDMADIEDVLSNSPIYSKKMLHFLVEHFNMSLIEGVVRQRLLICIARDAILQKGISPVDLQRQGDDLFFKNGKLSVSIAAKSINSVLIHFAMNVDSEGAPVKAAGLETDLALEKIRGLAENIMENYVRECSEIMDASCKVKGL